MEGTERFDQIDNCAFYKSHQGDFDGVYLEHKECSFVGKSTKNLSEPAYENVEIL